MCERLRERYRQFKRLQKEAARQREQANNKEEPAKDETEQSLKDAAGMLFAVNPPIGLWGYDP